MARFNKAVNNPIQLTYAWLLPPWVVVCHRGRRSGRLYRTPVNGYRRGAVFAAVILYGVRSDWVVNLLAAGGGSVVRGGRTYSLRNVRVLDPASCGPEVPALARHVGRVSGKLLVGELSGPVGRWGRGPAG